MENIINSLFCPSKVFFNAQKLVKFYFRYKLKKKIEKNFLNVNVM